MPAKREGVGLGTRISLTSGSILQESSLCKTKMKGGIGTHPEAALESPSKQNF